MDDLIGYFQTLAIIFVGSQLMGFILDLIKWAIRKKHPAKIKKSEDVSYPKHLTVSVWFDSHRFHGYKQIMFIRKGEKNTRNILITV